ncbi:hypothetical protein SUDANB6_00863 [Streptomyces sp. enrichment culture]
MNGARPRPGGVGERGGGAGRRADRGSAATRVASATGPTASGPYARGFTAFSSAKELPLCSRAATGP